MATRLLKVILLLALLSSTAIVLIHAHPYDNADLRAFLLPPVGCPAPCWLGIRPNSTTLEQTVAVLERMPSVEYRVYPALYTNAAHIVWSDSRTALRGSITLNLDIVESVYIQGLQFADLWLLLGPPDSGQYRTRYIVGRQVDLIQSPLMQVVYYTPFGMSATAPTDCVRFWYQSTVIRIAQASPPEEIEGNSPSLASSRQSVCDQRWQ